MFLETDRLVLRKFEEEDFDDFCDYAMDEEMSRLMGRKILKTREDALWNFNWLKDREERAYGLIYKETGRLIGNINLVGLPEDLKNLEELKGKKGISLSFSISRLYRRRGLMTEAILAIRDQVFYREEMDFIQCGHFSFNEASRKLQESLGFEYLTDLSYDYGDGKISTRESVLWKEKIK